MKEEEFLPQRTQSKIWRLRNGCVHCAFFGKGLLVLDMRLLWAAVPSGLEGGDESVIIHGENFGEAGIGFDVSQRVQISREAQIAQQIVMGQLGGH